MYSYCVAFGLFPKERCKFEHFTLNYRSIKVSCLIFHHLIIRFNEWSNLWFKQTQIKENELDLEYLLLNGGLCANFGISIDQFSGFDCALVHIHINIHVKTWTKWEIHILKRCPDSFRAIEKLHKLEWVLFTFSMKFFYGQLDDIKGSFILSILPLMYACRMVLSGFW